MDNNADEDNKQESVIDMEKVEVMPSIGQHYGVDEPVHCGNSTEEVIEDNAVRSGGEKHEEYQPSGEGGAR